MLIVEKLYTIYTSSKRLRRGLLLKTKQQVLMFVSNIIRICLSKECEYLSGCENSHLRTEADHVLAVFLYILANRVSAFLRIKFI